MSISALMAAPLQIEERFDVGVISPGPGFYGFSAPGGYGTITPATFTGRGGASNINRIGRAITNIFEFYVLGVRQQFHFQQIILQNDFANGWQVFQAADAVWSAGGGVTSWVWNTAVTPPWGTTGVIRTVRICY